MKAFNVVAGFIIMLCLGSVYAWSIFVPELKLNHGFNTTQTQLVFGVLIASFTLTMVIAGRIYKKFGPQLVTLLSGLLFGLGYLLAGFSGGHFLWVFLGIGIIAGLGTGCGYLVSITNPVKWYPQRKGLVTGIAAAGFGLGAIVLTWLSKLLLESGSDVLEIFRIIGLSYGGVILIFSFFIKDPSSASAIVNPTPKVFKDKRFYKLFAGIFCGTFAGLLVIGNLKPMGGVYDINEETLLLGVSVFSAANFAGRLVWGWLSDYMSGRISIFVALASLALFVFLMGYLQLSATSYLILSVAIGFGFGANFVLFAKETAHLFGVEHMGNIYPFVFLGYGIAGILGPSTGGMIFDLFGDYGSAAYIASVISLTGAAIAFIQKKKADLKS